MKKRSMNGKSLRIAALLALSAIAAATTILLLLPGTDPQVQVSEPRQSTAGTAPSSGGERQPAQIPETTGGSSVPVPGGTVGVGTQVTAKVTARNPFIADTEPAAPVSTLESAKVSASTSTTASGVHGSIERTTGPTSRPRYGSETAFFLSRLPQLRATLKSSRFFSAEYEVDPANPAIMVVLTDTEERARNLDGFFRFALDKDGETWGSAPLAVGIERLYTEAGRDRAYADGTFCSDGLDVLLDGAIRSMLGGAYEPGVTAFILERYREGMAAHVRGESRPSSRVAVPFTWLDVIYSEGYVNYVEFYPNPDVKKG